MRTKGMKLWIVFLLAALILAMGAGCAKSGQQAPRDYATEEEAEPAPAEEPAADGDFGFNRGDDEIVESDKGAGEAGQDYGNKIIKTAYMDMETYDFDETLQKMEGLLTGMGGYVESSSVSGQSLQNDGYVRRRAHFEFRVPQDSFLEFLNSVGDLGNVIDSSKGGQDISYQYMDTEARLESLEVQEERLLSILEKADKIEDVITLEQELSRIRYEIESLQGQLRHWDNLVSFSRVSVDVTEVREYTDVTEQPDTLGQRIGDTLRRSFKSLVNFLETVLVVLTAILPYLLLLGVIALIVILIVRAATKKQRALHKEIREKEKRDE